MHLITFDDEIIILLRKLEKSAIELKSKFENNESIEKMKGRLEVFNSVYEELESKTDKELFSKSNLSRHVSFLNRYLNQDLPQNCESDINNICETDIEQFRKTYLEKRKSEYIDFELENNIKLLIESDQFDSAVRKAFLTLTERLRSKYKISKDKDGLELISLIFGKNGISTIDIHEKESIRNLLSGLYGVFRNDFMHNLINKKKTEVSTIYMINTVLHLLNEIE